MIVTFRPLKAADGAQVLAWRNSLDVADYMYGDHQIGAAEHARWMRGVLSADAHMHWIIEAGGAPVGVANLAKLNEAARRCELGHYIAEPVMRGLGIGAAVEYILLQHVFETLGLNKLWCEVLASNEGAWRLHLQFGFQREAHFRDHVWKDGRFRDVYGLGALAADWRGVRSVCEARLAAKGFEPAALAIRAA